jgi:hypothetical protein
MFQLQGKDFFLHIGLGQMLNTNILLHKQIGNYVIVNK